MFIKILIGVGILVAVVLLLHGIRYILAKLDSTLTQDDDDIYFGW